MRGTELRGRIAPLRACMQMSMSCDSLRNVRAIAIALSAWLHDCGPTTWSVGQSTHARACAAISIPMSRGCELAPTFVRLLPREMRFMNCLLYTSDAADE